MVCAIACSQTEFTLPPFENNLKLQGSGATASSEEFCSSADFRMQHRAPARFQETSSTQQCAWCLQIARKSLQIAEAPGRDLQTAQIVASLCSLRLSAANWKAEFLRLQRRILKAEQF